MNKGFWSHATVHAGLLEGLFQVSILEQNFAPIAEDLVDGFELCGLRGRALDYVSEAASQYQDGNTASRSQTEMGKRRASS